MRTIPWIRSLRAFAFILACAGASSSGAGEYRAPQGASAERARDLTARFERLTGYRGQVAFYLADMSMADAPGPGGRVSSQRRLSGLPEGLARWLQADRAASRSPLFFVQAAPGSTPLCAVVQTEKNLIGSAEQKMRERLSAAYGADAWGWMIAHELGHCARSALGAQGQLERETRASASGEAFADVFALEWMRREGDPGFERYLAALIQERQGAGAEHQTAPYLERYKRERRSAFQEQSACQVAWRFSRASGPAGSLARLSC